MSRQEYIERISKMLDEIHIGELKRMNDFISGFVYVNVCLYEKENEDRE